MHEYSIVNSLVEAMLTSLKAKGAAKVVSVRFRRGSAFSEDVLRQAYEALTAGTQLEGARLRIDTVNLHFECKCGHKQVITNEELVGHMFVCPGCGALKEVNEAHDLELVEMVVEQGGAAKAP